jgi:hypothetical protein
MRRSFLVLLILFFAPLPTLSQDASTGAIRGTVLDPDGGLVPGASVIIVNAATGSHYSATTDANGHFAVDLLPPGDYMARAEIRGLSPESYHPHTWRLVGRCNWTFT